MKRKTWMVLVFACIAVFSFTGCNRQTYVCPDGRMLLRFFMPGSPTGDWRVVVEAVNEALKRDGLNIYFQPMWIPWNRYQDRINLMLATGEVFEMFHVMQDQVPTSTFASRNLLTGLSSLLAEYAPDMMGRFSSELWDSVTTEGEIFAIPAFWRYSLGQAETFLTVRKDMFDKFDLPIPRTKEEILSVLPVLQQRWAEVDGVRRFVYEHSLTRPPTALHRSYDTWPFYVSHNGLFQVRQCGEANMFFETPEFRKDAEFMNALFTLGLIHPDILNLPADTIIANLFQTGDFLLNIMTGPGWTTVLTARGIVPDAEIYRIKLNPERPMLMTMPLLNANAIPLAARHPEAAIKFLDWLYSCQANQDLLLYGIEGTHWIAHGTDGIERIRNPDGSFKYNFDNWMIEHVKFHRFNTDFYKPQQDKEWTTGIFDPDTVVISPVVGFNFDSRPVRVELANVLAEYAASIIPIKTGVIPFAENFPAAQTRMRAAGSDVLIAEYRRQLAEFLAGRN